MKVWIISDTHFNHAKIATYCDRPADFTQRIIANWNLVVKPDDCVIHLGDVFIGPLGGWEKIWPFLPGRKLLVRGNHDRQRSLTWWMQHGFDGACDGMMFRNWWLTHEPANSRPGGCEGNIHGHLHNIWHGFHPTPLRDQASPESMDEQWISVRKRLKHPWQRLFAIEYTNYSPVDFDKFVHHPEKFQARGPHDTQKGDEEKLRAA